MAEARTVRLPVRVELDLGVTVRPGDTLIIRSGTELTAAEAAVIKARVAERLPGIEIVVIAAEQLLVYRPGGDDRD